ncbi:MAG: tetratricopeptide repeat protein [Chitinophagaceae bacterium]|nr:tetratricopeptide repeat protein [Chitinophagaceae bacterium]
MKKIIVSVLLVFSFYSTFAQDAKELHETGRTFMMQGDYPNAILVLNRAIALQPDNIEIAKDLALNYYFSGNYTKAQEIIKPLLDREDADDQCYQIAGDIYLAQDNTKDCEKLYKKGIKKFPNSGSLYNEYGKLMWAQKNYDAIKMWEKGIEVSPSFSKNYFNACKFYYFSTDKVWSIIYGEIFLNMEPMSTSSPEIKTILLESYKKLFADTDVAKNNKENNPFVTAFLQTIFKQSNVVTTGINTDNLIMLRSRFILDWFSENANKFPNRLFDWQKQLLQEGVFEAYNHWIFTAAQNLPAYQTWTSTHNTEYTELTRFQKGRIFKIPAGQYYNGKN